MYTLAEALARHLAQRGLMRGPVPTFARKETAPTMPPGWTRTKLCGGADQYAVWGAVATTCGTQPFNLPGDSFPPPISAPFYTLEYVSDFIPGQVIARRTWQYSRVFGAPNFNTGYAPGADIPIPFSPYSPDPDHMDPGHEYPQYDPWRAPLPLMPPSPFPPEEPPYELTPELPQTSPQGDPLRGPVENPRPYQPWPEAPSPSAPPWPEPRTNPGPGPSPSPSPRPGGPNKPDTPTPVTTPDEEIDYTWEPEVPDKKKKPKKERDEEKDPVTEPPPGTSAPPDTPLKPWEREVDWRVTYEPNAEPRADRERHKNLPPVRGKEKEIKTFFRLQVPIVKALGQATEYCDLVDSMWKALPKETRQKYDSTEFLRKEHPKLPELFKEAALGNFAHYRTGVKDDRPKGKAWHDARKAFNERNKNAKPGFKSNWGRKATCQVKALAVWENMDKLANDKAMGELFWNIIGNEFEDRAIGKLGKGAAKHSNQTGQPLGWQGRGL